MSNHYATCIRTLCCATSRVFAQSNRSTGGTGRLTDAYSEGSDSRADNSILDEVGLSGTDQSRRLSELAVVVGRASEPKRQALLLAD